MWNRLGEKQLNSRPEIGPGYSNSRIYACPRGRKMAAAPPGTVSAFQGWRREGKRAKDTYQPSHVPPYSFSVLPNWFPSSLPLSLVLYLLWIFTWLAPSLRSGLRLDVTSSIKSCPWPPCLKQAHCPFTLCCPTYSLCLWSTWNVVSPNGGVLEL